MLQNEDKIVQQIQNYLEQIGAYHIKIHGGAYQRAGIPDILCCLNSRFIGIEVKDKGNIMSSLQIVHGLKIKQAGGIFINAYSLEDVKEGLKKGGVS